MEYAWWNDKDGNAQNVWSGNNTNGIHTCQCGIDGNCVDPALKCNCDAAAPVQLVDDGLIKITKPKWYHLINKHIFVVFRCHNGQKYSARHSIEFWPDSTGNFIRRPHVGPSRMQWISGCKCTPRILWGSLAHWPHPQRIIFGHGRQNGRECLLRFY
jgi:hypothetical protein